MNNIILNFVFGVITHQFLDFNSNLIKHPLKFGTDELLQGQSPSAYILNPIFPAAVNIDVYDT